METYTIGPACTYTLTDTDATKTLKVVDNDFTDDASNSEGPLTSACNVGHHSLIPLATRPPTSMGRPSSGLPGTWRLTSFSPRG